MYLDKLKDDFEKGISYSKLASKYGISKGTISKYKKKYKWIRNGTKISTKNSTVSKIVSKAKLSTQKTANDKRKKFCLLYLRYYNATKAYQEAYQVSYKTAAANAYKLMEDNGIKKLLAGLKKQQQTELFANANDVLLQDLKIMHSNIYDYLKIDTIAENRVDIHDKPMVDSDGKPIVDHYNEIYVKNPDEMDWSLVSEVHKGKDGLVVKLLDKQKAMKELLDRLPEAKTDSKDDPMINAVRKSLRNS
ncbi:terminase small subunit [Apilactobacillus apinorum]|nr:terminase small subunit [Apilactobacillus apinorum]